MTPFKVEATDSTTAERQRLSPPTGNWFGLGHPPPLQVLILGDVVPQPEFPTKARTSRDGSECGTQAWSSRTRAGQTETKPHKLLTSRLSSSPGPVKREARGQEHQWGPPHSEPQPPQLPFSCRAGCCPRPCPCWRLSSGQGCPSSIHRMSPLDYLP